MSAEATASRPVSALRSLSRVDFVDPRRLELVADELDTQSRRVFGFALLYGIGVQMMSLSGYMLSFHSGSSTLPLIMGFSALLLLTVLYCYRGASFSAVRRYPWTLLPLSLFCCLVMVADYPLVQSSFYDIAYVPFIFACFTGWRLWVIPAAGVAIASYVGGALLLGDGTSDSTPDGAGVLMVSDTLEFVLLAIVIAFFSGIFATQVANLVSAADSDSADNGKPLLKRLTPRELEVSLLVAGGLSNDEIASKMFLSPRTVESHILSARKKAASTSRTALAVAVALESKALVVRSHPTVPDAVRVELRDDANDGEAEGAVERGELGVVHPENS